MREQHGDLWKLQAETPNSVVCITTNGATRRDGWAVMGRGCARQASERYPNLQNLIGLHITQFGNTPAIFLEYRLLTFPVKHHWREDADLGLIQQSAEWLKVTAEKNPATIFFLPRPGCGNGRRDWETEVRPVLVDVGLPDNVVVVSP